MKSEAEAASGDGQAGRRKLSVWSDFVCPYCFLAERPLAEATEGLDVEIEWLPFELRPHPQPTLRPEGEYLQTVWRRSVYPLASRLGVQIRLPDVSPQPYSRLALEGMQFAREHGKAAEYVDAVFRAFFQRSLDIGEIGVLQNLARDIGLPHEKLRAALENGQYSAAHQHALVNAQALGIRAVPTIVAGELRIEGMPDAPALRRALLSEVGRAGAREAE
jgi:predicted DsbA family dithiol-disulfide isomerase